MAPHVEYGINSAFTLLILLNEVESSNHKVRIVNSILILN
jgi:hypothetical protein